MLYATAYVEPICLERMWFFAESIWKKSFSGKKENIEGMSGFILCAN